MSKISEYGNYDTDKSQTEVAKFQETGVLPVSGKYTDNGNMTTKNVKLSDLVGGGSGLPEIGSNDDGKVLTVDTDHAVWATHSGGGSDIPEMPSDADTYDYVLGIKDGKLAWVQLEVYLGSSSGFIDVEYKS